MSERPDSAALRRAALKVGLRITAACAVMVLAVIAAAAVYMLYQGQRPSMGAAAVAGPARVYVDTSDVLKAMVVAGLSGIVLAGVIGWRSARSAIRPLGAALALQRRFVQDASHELRTPLTILDARVQLAQRKAGPDSAVQEILVQVRQDTAALAGTVEELLLAATGMNTGPAPGPVDVAAVVGKVASDLQQVAAGRGITLDCSSEGTVQVRIQPNSLRRAVVALVDNAMAHTPRGGEVSIRTTTDGNTAMVTVSDTGAGITGIDQARVFERFARASTPGAAGHRSFGIGLALVREIAAGAGGTIEVAATGPQGTVMKMTLPVAPD